MTLSRKVKQIALVAALAFSANAAAPKPAQAIVGLAHGNVPLIVVGSILATLGVIGSGVGYSGIAGDGWGRVVTTVYLGFPSTAVGLLGIILLDGPSGPRLGYTELSPDQREQFGISDAEYEVYESQLEEIAALTDSGTASALSAGVRTEQEAKAHFDREYANLEIETRVVMAKIVQANLNVN